MIHYRISRDYTACGSYMKTVVGIGDDWDLYPKRMLNAQRANQTGDTNTILCLGCVRSDVFNEAVTAIEVGMIPHDEWVMTLKKTWKEPDDA